MENRPWIHTKNVGLLFALFILLNIIVLFVNHSIGMYRCRWCSTYIFQSWEYDILYYLYFSRHLRVRNVYSYIYCITIIFIAQLYTIAIYRYDINDLTPADFSTELLLGFVDIVRQTVVDFGSRIRYVYIIIYAHRHGYNLVINDSLKTARMQITQTRKFILGIKSHSKCLLVCACISKYRSR